MKLSFDLCSNWSATFSGMDKNTDEKISILVCSDDATSFTVTIQKQGGRTHGLFGKCAPDVAAAPAAAAPAVAAQIAIDNATVEEAQIVLISPATTPAPSTAAPSTAAPSTVPLARKKAPLMKRLMSLGAMLKQWRFSQMVRILQAMNMRE